MPAITDRERSERITRQMSTIAAAVTTAAPEIKAKHAAMWALGDYPAAERGASVERPDARAARGGARPHG